MDAQEKYQYWLKHAKYDLDTADGMFLNQSKEVFAWLQTMKQ